MKVFFLFVLFVGVVFGRTSCKDFDTQAEAQRYYDMRKPGWKRLDGDKDGDPCECLLGGSSYDMKVCKRFRRKYGKR